MAHGYAKKEFADPGWQDYTPAWTGASSNPAIGNGTITGRYTQIGTTVHFRVSIHMGSTTTFGSGAWFVSMPVTGADSDIAIGSASATDDSGGVRWVGSLHTNDGLKAFIGNEGGVTSSSWRSTTPMTWATTDELHVVGTYEAASSALINLGANDDHGSLSGLTDDDHSQYVLVDGSRDMTAALTGPGWTTYTPTWTTSGTAPSIGNGTNTARWIRYGDLVVVQGKLTIGSTTSVGTGQWYLATPGSMATSGNWTLGNAWIRDVTGADWNAATYNAGSDTVTWRGFTDGSSAVITNTVPMTWATGDWLSYSYMYETDDA